MWPLFVSLFVLLLQDPGTPSPAFTVKTLAWALLAGPWLLVLGVGAASPALRAAGALWLAYTGWTLAVDAEPALDLASGAGLALLTVWAWPAFHGLDFRKAAVAALCTVLAATALRAMGLGHGWTGQGFPLGNPNLNAYGAAALVLWLWAGWDRGGARGRAGLWLGVLAGLALMALAGSRGAWLGLGLGALPVLGARRSARGTRIGTGLALSALGGLVLVVALDPGLGGTLAERARWWAGSLALWREHPWTGVGPGRWMLEFPGTGLAEDNIRLVVRRPHGAWFRLLAETGLLGTLPLVSFWCAAWWRWFRVGGSAAWAGVGIVATVALSFDFPAESFPLLLGGMLWWAAAWPRGAFARTRAWTVAFAAAWVLLTGFAAWRWQAARAAEAVERARLAGQDPALEEALVRAGLWGVATQEDGWPLDALRAGRFRARGDTAAARRALDRALEIAPWSPQARNDAAALALEQGRSAHALNHTAAGLRAAPGRVDLRINRAIAWHELGHPAETLRTLSGVDSAACTPGEWALVRALRAACSAESR